ncbi:ribosome maturation factor RimP [Desulfobulbus alkaliphilus]|uniref:ribosome maturation factor RimP n=1 Tax=Desulfobulbus alkaliphilus TaxID=869814 RepID=UPI001965AB09|nr:ribosome maturation factor RimP [Desulfobulbus alkaliphilus]MBM9536883.1 ribosome maturation factor RimP [Desulfobulbus alkaliphilus]
MEANTDTLITTIQSFVEPMLADMAMELVDIQYRREGHGWVLRFFLDKDGGITIDDCARVSREISAYLEVENLIDHPFHLEVSSPGLERPLKKREDFLRFADRPVRIKVHNPLGGQRVLTGILRGLEGDAVALEMETGMVFVDQENISKARLSLEGSVDADIESGTGRNGLAPRPRKHRKR